MSNEITRFNHVTDWGMERDAKGDYVLHSDHEDVVGELTNAKCRWFLRAGEYLKRAHEAEAEVACLRAELNAATKAGLDAIATICEKEREVEWLRSWLPPMQVLVSAVEEEFCSQETEISEPDESKVSYPEEDCPITFGMIRDARKAIDYAMGEGK
ncbi:TPA: hypothetical protein R4K21_001396 [Stenotrophomonas maltophilia]|nr:hypothetical protein [Stenotrophomonas maltophilia]